MGGDIGFSYFYEDNEDENNWNEGIRSRRIDANEDGCKDFESTGEKRAKSIGNDFIELFKILIEPI